MSKTKWYFTSVAILTAALAVDLIGLSPWPLVFVLFAGISMAIAQKTGYLLATATTTVALLSGLAWWYQIAPHILGDLRIETLLVEVFGVLGFIIFIGTRGQLALPTRNAIGYYWPAFIVPSLSAITVWVWGVTGNLGYSWAMHNDAVWNIVVSRFVTSDGGIVSTLHSNPSPLVPELLSYSSLSGRTLASSASLFQHDITRAAEAWILIALLSSLIAGLISLSIFRIQHNWLRIIAAVAVSLLPLTWFSFGYALEFGFYNATLALLLMLTTWVIWQTSSKQPFARLGALGFALLASLAAWGPLALIPASLTILGTIQILIERNKPESAWSLWFVGLPWASAFSYGMFVTLPDLRQQSGSLGADGGIFEITPMQAAITVGTCFLAIALSSLLLKQKDLLLGISVFTGSSLVAIAYLALQRGANVSRWGYYPVKYSWLLMCALLVIAVAFALAWISSTKMKNRTKVLATFLAGIVLFAVAWQMPIRIAPTYLSAVPIANIVTHTGVAGEDAYANRLFTITVSGQPTIAYRGTDVLSDQFADKWLLQLESKSSQDKIRYWAYFMDPTNQDHLCRALLDWDTKVKILTNDKDLGTSLKQNCPTAHFSIQFE